MKYQNKNLFAVTDYFEILTLKIIHETDVGHAIVVHTSLEQETENEKNEIYHKESYSQLFITLDGNLIKNTVFFTYDDAKAFATLHINEQLEKLKTETTQLTNILNKL
jgi:hypothetical protein